MRKALGLTAVIVASMAVPSAPQPAPAEGPAERTIPVSLFPGASRGAVDPGFQALILGGAWTRLPAGRRARGLDAEGLRGLFAWLRPPLALAAPRARYEAGAFPREPLASAAAADSDRPLGIEHDDVGCVVAESYPRFRACVTPRPRLGRAQVFFRPQGTEPWYAVDMEPDGECYAGLLPKPKASLGAFEYYIGAVDTDFDEVSDPPAAPESVFTARVVKSEGDCEKGRRMATMATRVTAPILMETAASAPVPAGFSAEGVAAGAPAGVNVSLVATGASSGDVLQLQAVNASGEPVRLVLNPGTVMVPVRKGSSTPVAASAKGGVHTASVRGFCLDFAKAPPAPGTSYRLAEPEVAGRFRSLARVLAAGNRLARNGGLHPDSDPASYADSIRQWSLWTRLAGWDAAQFADAFVGRTRKNVEEMKHPWTPEMEGAIRAAAPGRWRDIRQVLNAAGAGAGPAQP